MQAGFFGGNILKLTEDLAILKPTLFPSVLRLFNRFYCLIKAKLTNAKRAKKLLIDTAVKTKL